MLSNNKNILKLSSKDPNFLTDKIIVEKQYYETFGRKINWKNPKTYNEKLQILKLTDDSEDLWPYVDKITVRNQIKKKMVDILTSLGCTLIKEHYSKREIWENGQVQFEFIDYFKPAKLSLIEIEGPNNEVIQTLIDSLGSNVKVAGEELFKEFDKNTNWNSS